MRISVNMFAWFGDRDRGNERRLRAT